MTRAERQETLKPAIASATLSSDAFTVMIAKGRRPVSRVAAVAVLSETYPDVPITMWAIRKGVHHTVATVDLRHLDALPPRASALLMKAFTRRSARTFGSVGFLCLRCRGAVKDPGSDYMVWAPADGSWVRHPCGLWSRVNPQPSNPHHIETVNHPTPA